MENMNEKFSNALRQEQYKDSAERFKSGTGALKYEVEKNTDPETGEYKPYHERIIEKVEKELPDFKDEECKGGGL